MKKREARAFFKKAYIISSILIILFISAITIHNTSESLNADATMGMPAAEQVLIIRLAGSTYRDNLYNNIRNSIIAAGGVVTTVTVANGDNDGIWDDLQAQLGCSNATTCLDQFCEVWDIRFNETHNAAKATYAVGTWDDTITCCGGTTDSEILQTFLQHGGHLYMQGEHDEFSGRNVGLLQFIGDVSGAISWPGILTSQTTWTTFAATPENFSTDFQVLTQVDTYYPGIITSFGRGRPVTTRSGGTQSLDLAFLASDMLFGNGKMFVNFDTNEFTPDTWCTGGCFTANQEGYYIQNVYDFLSNCYQYTVTKTVNPGTVCVGQNATYQICYNNIGSKALPALAIWDTIPNCLNPVSATPAWSYRSGNYVRWDLAGVPVGTNTCINVVVNATCVP